MSFVVLHDNPVRNLSFADRIMGEFGAQAYWRFTDIVDATVPVYKNSSSLNGTQVGLTVQDTASPIASDSGLAPRFDGTSDYASLFTAAFVSLLNKQEFSFMLFAKMLNVGVWADGTNRVLFSCVFNSADVEGPRLTKIAAGTLRFNMFLPIADLSNNDITSAVHGSTTDWFQWTITYKEGVRLRSLFNGVEIVNRSAVGSNPWVSNPNEFFVGAISAVPASVHNGWTGGLGMWNRELSTAETAAIFAARLT